jgi:hypothetical protein
MQVAEGKKRQEVEDELFTKRFGRPDAGQPVDQRRKLVDRVRGLWTWVRTGMERRESRPRIIVSHAMQLSLCLLLAWFVLSCQVRRELHGYEGEMAMEWYMGGRLMGGSSSINGEQVRARARAVREALRGEEAECCGWGLYLCVCVSGPSRVGRLG